MTLCCSPDPSVLSGRHGIPPPTPDSGRAGSHAEVAEVHLFTGYLLSTYPTPRNLHSRQAAKDKINKMYSMLDGDKKYGEKAGKGDGKCYWGRGNHNYVRRLRVLLKENSDSNENECLQLLTTISMNPQNTMLSKRSEAMRVHSVQSRAQKQEPWSIMSESSQQVSWRWRSV